MREKFTDSRKRLIGFGAFASCILSVESMSIVANDELVQAESSDRSEVVMT